MKSATLRTVTNKSSRFGSEKNRINANQMRKLLAVDDIELNPIIGKWPEFQMLDKELLCIDRQYQREPDRGLVIDIARNCDRGCFQALCVSDRGNGTLAIMEGGQRWSMSLHRDDVSTVPCLVYKFDKIEDEAKVFEVINKKRRAVSAMRQFYARLVQKDVDALALMALVKDADFTLDDNAGPDAFSCIAVLQAIYRKHKRTRPSHFADLLILIRCLEDNGAATFRTMGFVVNAISDLMDMSYSRIAPDVNALQRCFKGIDFDQLINEVSITFNGIKAGNKPSKREILTKILLSRCSQP